MTNREALPQIIEAIKQTKLAKDNIDLSRQSKSEWCIDNALDNLNGVKKEIELELEASK